MGDTGAVKPVEWTYLNITAIPGIESTVQTSYAQILSVNGIANATVQVLLPSERGVVYSQVSGLANGASATPTPLAPGTTATFDGLLMSIDIKAHQLVFKPSPSPAITPIVTSTSTVATSTIATSSSQGAASITSNGAPSANPASGSVRPSNTASTTNGSAQQAKGSNALSTGAIAGIAIGCLAAGALLAALILWFCWWRKKAPKPQYSGANTYAMASQEKGFSANTVPLAGVEHTAADLGGGLPQPLEDKAITGDISKISNAIKNHVQSYYHTSRISPGLIDYDDLHALGPSLPISVGTLTTLMGNTATREIALRFIIAWVVVSRLQPSKDPAKSLLPSEVAQCYQTISTVDRGFQAQASLMARWRVMTAELIQSNYVRNPFTSSDSRNASIQSTFTVLDSVLQPYADSRMNNEERKRNLEELLKRSALFAFTMFSQPSAWEFEWQEEQGVTSGELCIFPALVQVADETGQSVSPPRPFSEAVVRRLDG